MESPESSPASSPEEVPTASREEERTLAPDPSPKEPAPPHDSPCSSDSDSSSDEDEEGSIMRKIRSSVAQIKLSLAVLQEGMKPQNVTEGESVQLSCEISGKPAPEVEWLKNNKAVSGASNIRLSRCNNIYTLEICEATVSDSGEYTMKAKNRSGQCFATASINVISVHP